MIALTLLAAAAMIGLYAVVLREPATVTVNPFAAPPAADPGADTIANAAADPTLAGDMNRVELSSLSDAEDLLDHLEMIHARDRSLEVVGNSTFVIRWR